MGLAVTTVKGRLTSPTTVELYAPLPMQTGGNEVEVVLARETPADNSRMLALLEHLRSLPPGNRSREDIDRQIQEERDSWE
jgi:hypothetical protein